MIYPNLILLMHYSDNGELKTLSSKAGSSTPWIHPLLAHSSVPQPDPTVPLFRRWKTKNIVIKGWLINTMDSSLVSTFIWYPTAKEVWDAIVVTFFNGSDTVQVYELQRWVSRLRQNGGSLEKFYNEPHGRKLNFRRPNPMEYPKDVQRYTAIL